ncbi:MAG: hypothetical protein HY253_03305 [Burkholderiales bacterium]|nr:hypothetical protein [Burkholderiales bacterium]
MSIGAIKQGLSGMTAYQKALDCSGHNVANACTDNFKSQQVDFQELQEGGVIVNISQQAEQLRLDSDNTQTGSDTDLAKEIVNSLQYQHGFELSAQLIRRSDEMLDSLLKIK